MSYHHLSHNRRHPSNNPQPARVSSIKRKSCLQQQMEQNCNFDEEPEANFRIPSSSSVKDVVSMIGAVVILIIALEGFKTESPSTIGIAAFLLALLLGGYKAVETFLRFLKDKVS